MNETKRMTRKLLIGYVTLFTVLTGRFLYLWVRRSEVEYFLLTILVLSIVVLIVGNILFNKVMGK